VRPSSTCVRSIPSASPRLTIWWNISQRRPSRQCPEVVIELDSCRWYLGAINEFEDAENLAAAHVLIRSYDGAKDNGSTMPMFMCRWRNGDLSFVFAADEDEAIVQLDECGTMLTTPKSRA